MTVVVGLDFNNVDRFNGRVMEGMVSLLCSRWQAVRTRSFLLAVRCFAG
jgi:hypothetical protein